MLRKLAILLATIAGGCGGGGAAAPPLLVAEELREGCVGSALDVVLGAIDLFARAAEAEDIAGVRAAVASCATVADAAAADVVVACAGATVRGEPVTMVVTIALVQGGARLSIEADGLYPAAAELVIAPDPELGFLVLGTVRAESPDGCVVDGTLDGVLARLVADLPGAEIGALFSGGSVDLGVRADGAVVATGTAALHGRAALVLLRVGRSVSEADLSLGR